MAPLVLFDIDGTLVWGATRLHAGAFAAVLTERYGAADPFETAGDLITCGGLSLGGRLDAEIARWCLAAAGIAEDDHDAELAAYCDAIVARYAADAAAETGAHVLPGVVDVLEALSAAGAPCGVVTGNLEPIARRKLEAVGLARYFTRRAAGSPAVDGGRLVGGFGAPPARQRAELFEAAARRAAEAGVAFEGLVYVGDTPLDAAAATAAGVPFVGVATGRYSVADLRQAARGGRAVFPTLAAPGVVEALLDAGGG